MTAMAFDTKPFNEDGFMCKEFISLKKRYKISTVVETGTYKGMTTKWLGENFKRVFTTEIIPAYHEEAKKFLAEQQNINCFLGDSRIVLPEILKQCDNNTIIFIDSHWYENPMRGELEMIKNSGLKPILAIHDFKNPNHPDFGFDIYPEQNVVYEWSFIENHINAIYGDGGYTYYYNEQAEGARRGCVFIISKKVAIK